jgi:hypothetical protein
MHIFRAASGSRRRAIFRWAALRTNRERMKPQMNADVRRFKKSLPQKRQLPCAFAVIVLLFLGCRVSATEPSWWREYRVLSGRPADDFAAANSGQLKNIAVAAYWELERNLPHGAGLAARQLVSRFSNSNNFAAISLGQLKTVAKPFYDRLIAEGVVATYPWRSGTTADDSAAANLGQLKNVFNFEIPPRK